MKELNLNNAAKRSTYVGNLFELGSRNTKKIVLESIKDEYSKLHKEGYIHIHDLEAYGKTYNCLTPDILKDFPYDKFIKYSDTKKIIEIIEYYKYIISNLANEQTGGIAFANFDSEFNHIFKMLNISISDQNLELLKECIDSFIQWINISRIRYGQECYYVSLNLGLCTEEVGRFVSKAVIETFMYLPSDFIRPNIIFKVKNGLNKCYKNPNYDLFCLAVECTAKKMIPTYLLCDSEPNKNFDPYKIAIMGCRTRVMQNLHGEETSIGRGNIDYITINLPRIALEVESCSSASSTGEKLHAFEDRWLNIAKTVKEILLDRYNKLLRSDPDNFPFNINHKLWIGEFKYDLNLEDTFKNGTLALGFIGLSEAVEILTEKKYYSSTENHRLAINIVKFMRENVDSFKREENLNFTLLATPGEFVSGRFPEIDGRLYKNNIIDKGYYTNSFHVDVNSGMHPFEKLRYEGPFHGLCNGGCISYVEFISAPLKNTEAIIEIIDVAIKYGINYLGINFPLDICKKCGATGTFDYCDMCGSKEIKRIRRISGYLEDIEFFTKGKKAEVKYRRPNEMED